MRADNVRYHCSKLLHLSALLFLTNIFCAPAALSFPNHSELHDFRGDPGTSFTTFAVAGTSVHAEADSDMAAASNAQWPGNKWNWVIYSLILLLILFIIRRYEVSRIKIKSQVKIANIEMEKLKDIDQLKSRFYANISHEFRTPLTLIKGPLEELMLVNDDQNTRKIYQQMHNSTCSLLDLINQLLDLSKIESGYYALKARQGDIVGFVEGLALSFTSLAEQKEISLETQISPEFSDSETRNALYYDPDILDKIINNLISNAFKFTPKGGRIIIQMKPVREDHHLKLIEFCIEDTGIGITADKIQYIFDRFYQVNSEDAYYEGSGVGLSIVHELVKLHKVEIFVTSKPGSGTKFTVRIPYGSSHFSPEQIDQVTTRLNTGSRPPQVLIPKINIDPGNGTNSESDAHPLILVVEDHEQVRSYIINSIHTQYKIIQAEDALRGFDLAEEFIPDLIISDIMMPGMDGFSFCKKIKTSKTTSHIPVILLTARADMNDRIVGLKEGADDYLTKPFNAEELRIRIDNLIQNRHALRQKFSTSSIIKPGEISVSSHDTKLVESLLALVEKNISNVQYSVEDFSRDAGLSQSQLHRKLTAIIAMSANQFIRSVRMHKAMNLLKNGSGNISEIAYKVGYEDPGYFTKTFSKFFNKLPSQVTRQE